MLDNRILLTIVVACFVLIPGWIIQVTRTSWNLLLKKQLIGALVVISALGTGLIIATPNPHLPTKIISSLFSIIV